MITRALESIAVSDDWGRQMRFVVGPRQTGKTTLLKSVLNHYHAKNFYYNWDEIATRRRFREDPNFLTTDLLSSSSTHPWVAFDEIHKYPGWRNVLKGIFDAHEPSLRLLVSGSARLDLLKKSGDSLAGRYFVFHLFPLSLQEATKTVSSNLKPPTDPNDFVKERISRRHDHQKVLLHLLRTSGFPEPFLNDSEAFQAHWHRDYFDRMIRDDLRDLTRIQKIEHVTFILKYLAASVGNPLSINSIRENIEDSYNSVKNYIRALRLLYITFQLKPYSRKIARSLLKAPKVYLFDWTLVDDEGRRFENFVAFELNALVHKWLDSGFGEFELFYVRRKDGRETDFLITKQSHPWMLLEAKLKSEPIERHHYDHSEALGKIPIVQIVKEPNILKIGQRADYQISASRFF